MRSASWTGVTAEQMVLSKKRIRQVEQRGSSQGINGMLENRLYLLSVL